jgi:hypothetical protein
MGMDNREDRSYIRRTEQTIVSTVFRPVLGPLLQGVRGMNVKLTAYVHAA